jgi:hypothetical protein
MLAVVCLCSAAWLDPNSLSNYPSLGFAFPVFICPQDDSRHYTLALLLGQPHAFRPEIKFGVRQVATGNHRFVGHHWILELDRLWVIDGRLWHDDRDRARDLACSEPSLRAGRARPMKSCDVSVGGTNREHLTKAAPFSCAS